MEKDLVDDNVLTWRNIFLMKPENYLRFVWELFVMFFLIILGFLLPYINAFEPDNQDLSTSIDIASISIFSLDIAINFNTGFYEKGILIMDRAKIFKNYLTFWFWIDIITTIPIDQFIGLKHSSASNPSSLLKYIRVVRVLKLIKLIRLTKLKVMIIKIKDRISNKKLLSYITVFKLLLYLFLVAHFYACLIYSVSSDSLSPDTFVYIIANKADERVESNGELYVTCLYWALVTMSTVGYGDFSPKTTIERIVGIIIMISSSFIFGFIIGNISSTIEKQGQKQKERRETITNLNCFMKLNKFSKRLKTKTRKYLEYRYAHEKSSNIKTIDMLSLLSEPLQQQILEYTNGSLLNTKEIFKNFDNVFINKLTRLLENKIFSPGDFLIQEGYYSKGMFFITGGLVKIYDESTRSRIQNLSQDNILGEIGLFTKSKCASTAIAASFVDVYFIEINAFYQTVEFYPRVQSIVEQIQDSCQDGNYTALNIYCYICKTLGHIAKNCTQIRDNEISKKRWLARNLEPELVNGSKSGDKVERKKRSVQVKHTKINVVGKPRKPNQMFPHYSRLVSRIFNYFSRVRSSVNSQNYDLIKFTEESMRSRSNSSMNPILENLNNIIEESDEEVFTEHFRDIKFDLNLIK